MAFVETDARALVERIGRGDQAAEETLFQLFHPRVVAFVQMRASDRDLAEEIGQEAILAVLCALRQGQLRQAELLASYVYGTARNLLNDRIRRRAREKTTSLELHAEPMQASVDFEEDERQELARRAIQELEPADRRILLMTLVDGCKPGEIASKMRMSSEVVRQRKSRALKKIIQKLAPLSRIGGAKRLESGEDPRS
jgi:RNA polymerase sigma factor (sigma-70 family)